MLYPLKNLLLLLLLLLSTSIQGYVTFHFPLFDCNLEKKTSECMVLRFYSNFDYSNKKVWDIFRKIQA